MTNTPPNTPVRRRRTVFVSGEGTMTSETPRSVSNSSMVDSSRMWNGSQTARGNGSQTAAATSSVDRGVGGE